MNTLLLILSILVTTASFALVFAAAMGRSAKAGDEAMDRAFTDRRKQKP